MFHRIYFTIRFIVYILIFLILYTIAAITNFKYSNCWIYAIEQYLKNGGYIVFRRTNFNNSIILWEHALWTKDLREFHSFVPKNAKTLKNVPPLLFNGKLLITDEFENVIYFGDQLC